MTATKKITSSTPKIGWSWARGDLLPGDPIYDGTIDQVCKAVELDQLFNSCHGRVTQYWFYDGTEIIGVLGQNLQWYVHPSSINRLIRQAGKRPITIEIVGK